MAAATESFPPFAALPRRARGKMGTATHVEHARRGSVLFQEGEPAESLYVVASGHITLQRQPRDGCFHTVCHVTDQGLACCVPALDGEPYPATALASRDSMLLRVPCSLFREMLQTRPGFAGAVLRHLGRQLRRFLCDGAPAGNAGARVAGRILAGANQFGLDVPLTRREIAEMAGTTVETAIRETRAFEKQGWIRLARGHLRVVDRDALSMRAGGQGSPSPRPQRKSAKPASK